MFYQTFLSPQVKQSVIIINTHSIYKVSQELPNLPKYLRKLGNIRKIPKLATILN